MLNYLPVFYPPQYMESDQDSTSLLFLQDMYTRSVHQVTFPKDDRGRRLGLILFLLWIAQFLCIMISSW